MNFPTKYSEILERIKEIDPIKYGQTRNHLNGAVTYLSPYISRGVISTKLVLDAVLAKGYPIEEIESLVKELSWRDYFQRLGQVRNLDNDIKFPQSDVERLEIPLAVVNAESGIHAIDQAIEDFYANGYMHNHMRMYTAALVTNIGKSHWLLPSKWMYFHLLDGDWASNRCSWQWVCGANAPKVYYANQENINKYTGSVQKGTPLDTTYEELSQLHIACTWVHPKSTFFPEVAGIDNFQAELPTLLYTPYHLDPNWRKEEEANRILFWDLEQWQDYPFNENIFNWINELAHVQIPDLQVVVGDWKSIQQTLDLNRVFTKEHPLTANYGIHQDPRDWLWPQGNELLGSFFNYWKKVQKHLRREN